MVLSHIKMSLPYLKDQKAIVSIYLIIKELSIKKNKEHYKDDLSEL